MIKTLHQLLLVCVLFAGTFGIACADSYERGVWWDFSAIDKENMTSEISAMRKYGVSRVHVQISHPVFGMKLYEDCKAAQPKSVGSCAAKKYSFNFDTWADTSARKVNLGDFVDELRRNGMKVVLMIWPIPTAQYVASLKRLTDFTKRHEVYAIETEAEENWDMKYSNGDFPDLAAASKSLLDTLRTTLPAGVKIAVTTAPRNFSASHFQSDAILFKSADIVSFQSYQNIYSDDGSRVTYANLSGDYAVGTMQKRAIDTFLKIASPQTELILGLPAYDQASPTMSGEISMYIAAKQSVCGSDQVGKRFIGGNYWSWANIKSKKRDASYAKRFLENCRPEKIALQCSKTAQPPQMEELTAACPALFK